MIGSICMGIIVGFEKSRAKPAMKSKKKCVCSLVNKLGILYGHNLEGEIFFKHSPKCRFKTTGNYE
jgi:hypothetical protein